MPTSFWVSSILVIVELAAGVAVGVGIVFESGKPETPKERVGQRLVIFGVVIEAVAGFCLFGFDGYQIAAEARTIDDLQGKLRDAASSARTAKTEADAANAIVGVAFTNAADASNEATNALSAADAANSVATSAQGEVRTAFGEASKALVAANAASKQMAGLSDKQRKLSADLAAAKKDMEALKRDQKFLKAAASMSLGGR